MGRTTVILKMLDPSNPAARRGQISKKDQVAAAGARWSMASMAFLMARASFFWRAWAFELKDYLRERDQSYMNFFLK